MPDPSHKPQLTMIHTVSGLVEGMAALAERFMPPFAVTHRVDESLLSEAIRQGGLTPDIYRRLLGEIVEAGDQGADAIIVTCSSMGAAVEAARPFSSVRLFRIDEGMALEAVRRGRRIGVLATLSTTLAPTGDLIRASAVLDGRDGVTVSEHLREGAFARLRAGDIEGHDAQVGQAILDLAETVDVIVLAQASMARARDRLALPDGAVPVLTSPESGMRHIAACLAADGTGQTIGAAAS